MSSTEKNKLPGRTRPAKAATHEPNAANALWGGRFSSGPSALMQRINASIDFDRHLYRQDIAASQAHATMLAAQNIISADDGAAIAKGLEQILNEIESGTFSFRFDLEDIHMNVEARLAELIGPAAGRLHTARSRNDQVATDFRLWVRDALDRLDAALCDLQSALIEQAERHVLTVMPGFTHLQAAQPITFAHHLLAYVEMFGRDRGRAADCRVRLNECPLGAAALAGTSFPIDRMMTAKALSFARPTANSIDSVSDRDFAVEYLATAALAAVHLSRLAEELVLWSSAQFAFIRMSDSFTTGSSIMPQKRNPDAAELVRGKTGRVIGSLTTLLTCLKGLPLAYSKDMQEDKEPVFDADETLAICIAAAAGMIRDMTVNIDALRHAAHVGFTTATDLADWLVSRLALPFREAHHIAGRMVRLAEEKGCDLGALTLAEIHTIEPRLTADALAVLTVERSVESRASLGGTAPSRVREAIAKAKDRFL